MEIMIGEEFAHLTDKLVEELVSLLVGESHRGIENAALALDGGRPGAAGKLRVANKRRCAVARHIELGYDANPAVARIRDQFADFILRVVQPVRTQGVQLRKFFALGAESLILRKVPVEDVHLHRFEAVEIALEDIERNKVAGRGGHQSPPGEAGLGLYVDPPTPATTPLHLPHFPK